MDQVITKICSKCKIEKVVDEFYKSKRNKDGLNNWCKDCAKEYNKTYVYKGIIQEVKTKICSTCKVEKAIEEFHNNKSQKDGFSNICIKCAKEYYRRDADKRKQAQKEYNKINRDKQKTRRKEYYKKHADTIKNNQKEYRKRNINELKRWHTEYKQRNINRIRDRQKEYYKSNFDKIQQKNKQNIDKTKEYRKQYLKSNALYKTYSDKLLIYNSIKETSEGYLEVQCKYCDSWIIPTNSQAQARLQACEANTGKGEAHFYCNNNNDACKQACPSFGVQLYPRGFKPATSREVDPLLRQMCFERDGWQCVKCGNTVQDAQLHAHHIEGAVQSPMTANDIDNVITVCKQCHKEIHKQKGCYYSDFQREKCAA